MLSARVPTSWPSTRAGAASTSLPSPESSPSSKQKQVALLPLANTRRPTRTRSRSTRTRTRSICRCRTSTGSRCCGSSRPYLQREGESMGSTGVVLFLCPHNAAKSVLAAAYFDRLAQQRGLPYRVDSAGTKSEAAPTPAVVDALQAEGVDVSGHRPRSVKERNLVRAPRSFDGLRPNRGGIGQRTS